MEYATERDVTVEFLGEEYSVKLVMIPMRKRMTLIDADDSAGQTALKFFEATVAEISGPPVNGKEIKTAADVIDSPGLDALYVGIQAEIGKWNPGEDEIKNS